VLDTATVTWSQPSTYKLTGVHHGYRTAPANIDDLDLYSVDDRAVKAWWGMLEPGGFIVPHIDASPWFVRWHYPIEPAGYIWQLGATGFDGVTVESPSEPFEIRHYEPHAVWNPGPARRVHLIIELSERVPGDSGLVMCGMLPEIQELIDAI